MSDVGLLVDGDINRYLKASAEWCFLIKKGKRNLAEKTKDVNKTKKMGGRDG